MCRQLKAKRGNSQELLSTVPKGRVKLPVGIEAHAESFECKLWLLAGRDRQALPQNAGLSRRRANQQLLRYPFRLIICLPLSDGQYMLFPFPSWRSNIYRT